MIKSISIDLNQDICLKIYLSEDISVRRHKSNDMAASQPTIFLPKIDPATLVAAYQAGHYVSVRYPTDKPLLILAAAPELNRTVSTSTDEETYLLREPGCANKIITTLGHEAYVLGDVKESGRCLNCLEDYSTGGCGIFIKYEFLGGKYHIFHSDSTELCSANCQYTFLKSPYCRHDNLYDNSILYLQTWFNLIYPGRELVGAPDVRLLKMRGGPVGDVEYRAPKHVFIRTTNVIFVPVKIIYYKINKSK